MPQNGIFEVELFYIWIINFMGSFPPHNNLYILVVIDHVSKWVEPISTPPMIPRW